MREQQLYRGRFSQTAPHINKNKGDKNNESNRNSKMV